ncbi:hypothetical protein EHS25_004604 [Saitozyma podzolica]|uniref:Rab-GAP TBC domain-containing protein n=1 Tax=Saitozyma podzolica TaxID=1890683 RepID=A0A427YUI3_9TREE|nr:hypothetical protein EHS25_004604 [Saitozyma podzolica]
MSPAEVYEHLAGLLHPQSSSSTSRHRSSSEISDGLKRIRRSVLTEGIPEVHGRPSLRPRIWKLMLKVESLNTEDYLRYVSMGPSDVSTKIKNDTFRTLATDTQFKGKVKEDMLIRLLEAFVWKNHGSERDGLPFTYVQGMNVLSAPFLYTMPSQLEAFACFSTFIEHSCPLYVQPTLVGVHRGLKGWLAEPLPAARSVFEDCRLGAVRSSPEQKPLGRALRVPIGTHPLRVHTAPRGGTATMGVAVDSRSFLLSFGVHLNILCVIAQLLLMRQDLMDSPSPMKILRTFPPLDARPVIGVTVALVKDIPEDLYRELVAHPFAS